ncbi:D-2-hydroxyacid dehydrogenase [Listeria newyorkensis]|uniref:D-2-hydroxyacid dehydrogenase n=1 Tax=Listeria newyorkensis TaxID=1497681 RepID=A0A841Z046_9LIST|nr:D-2-hydroxyacid dehydrogenase [Listeria newyorkensis]MBC1458243.1 D-2-hydroxyacid dehydrogenase [Listeria newyorkensis]
MKILFTMPIPDDLKAKQQEQFPDHTYEYIENLASYQAIDTVDCIVSYGSDITESIIEDAKALRWLMIFSAGIEELPHAKLQEKSILVTNVRGIHAIPMAEFTMAYMLSYVKRLAHFATKQTQNSWERDPKMGELAEKTIIIAGTGAIGSQIAQFAKAFQMKTIGINTTGKTLAPFDKAVSIEEMQTVLPEGDFIVSVLPETNATRSLYKKAHFEAMKNSAVFINIGRGSAVSEETLLDIATNKTIAHLYLDVSPIEPLPKNHALWNFPNVTVTPHVSAHSPKYLYRSFDIWLENVARFQKEEPLLNTINLNRGY